MNLAFVGLGQMGRPMALNLLNTGTARLTVMSASPRHCAEFEGRGAHTARQAGELGDARIVFAAATATYQTALRRGHGDEDKGAMVRVFEDLLGVRFRHSTAAIEEPAS